MSHLSAISAALADQHHRYLTGGDRGIAKAIAARETPTVEDYEWLAKIVAAALDAERKAMEEGVAADLKHDARVALLAELPVHVLRQRLGKLQGLHVGPEINGGGHRHTGKAVANQAARDAWPERRALEEAIALHEGVKD